MSGRSWARTGTGVAPALLWIGMWHVALAAAPQLKPVTLVLEWTGIQPQHFGFWIAKQRGWYAKEGLDVTIKNSSGSTQAIGVWMSKPKTGVSLDGSRSTWKSRAAFSHRSGLSCTDEADERAHVA